MTLAARDEYLTTEVLTAAPQKLHLMLIEGAIRFATRAQRHRQQQEHEAAFRAVVRAQEIVSQLMAGFAANLDQLVVRQAAGVYSFIYRSLVLANVNRDSAKLADALRLLEIERETWRQVCAQLGHATFCRLRESAGRRHPRHPHRPVLKHRGEHRRILHRLFVRGVDAPRLVWPRQTLCNPQS